MQDAGEREAAESGADDRDGGASSWLLPDRGRPVRSGQSAWYAVPDVGTTFQTCQDSGVATRTRRSQRRTEALSRERIVEAAVELLDAAGEGGLTFRALTERLATGPGAIYWHVANKGELLGAATDAVVAAALAVEPAELRTRRRTRSAPSRSACSTRSTSTRGSPRSSQRSSPAAPGVGDAADPRKHRPAGPRAGVPEGSWFTATIGADALHPRRRGPERRERPRSRARRGPHEFLDAASTAWAELDPDDYPFTRAVADQMRDHDDREQFLAGIDLILTGIATSY